MLNGACSDSSKFKSHRKTRGLQRIDAFEVVEGFSCRDNVIDTSHASFEFILTLRVVEQYMSYTESLTWALQAKAADIVQAVEHVRRLKKRLV